VLFKQEGLTKIMNRFRLKITGAVVLTLAAIAGVYTFWPAKTKPVAESKDARHLQKEEKRPSQARPKTDHHDGLYLKDPQVRKFRSEPPKWSRKQNYFTDIETDFQYKPSRQLSKVPGRYYKRYPGVSGSEPLAEPPQWQPEELDIKGRERTLERLRSLRAKKPVERVRPELPEGAELKISEEQMQKMHESVLLHLLEEYKDSPEQAEQIRKILLERLKHLQEEREAAAKENKQEK